MFWVFPKLKPLAGEEDCAVLGNRDDGAAVEEEEGADVAGVPLLAKLNDMVG